MITSPDGPEVSVQPFSMAQGCRMVSPLRFARRKIAGAKVIDSDGTLWCVKAFRIERIAGQRGLGLGEFVFDTLIGLLFLDPSVVVRFELEQLAQWDLATVKKHVCELISRNPDAYTHYASDTRLRRLVATCRSFPCIGAAIMGNPTPNELE